MKLALKGYAPSMPPDPPKPLSEDEKDAVKGAVRTVLKDRVLSVGSALHRALGVAKKKDGITATRAQIMAVISEMGEAGEFEPGFGPQPPEVETIEADPE